MKHIEHIFFDLDHTLWDFEKNSSETLSELFEEFGLEKYIDNKERFLATYHTVNGQYWKKYNHGLIDKQAVRFGRFSETLNRFKVPNHKTLGREIGDTYVQRGPHKKNLFPDAHETLEYLYKKYPLHIITNGFKEVQFIKLNGAGLLKYFDIILCSEDVGVNKPNKKVFYQAMEMAKSTPSNSLMIGDNLEADIQGAQSVGMSTILFDPKKKYVSYKLPFIQHLKDLRQVL